LKVLLVVPAVSSSLGTNIISYKKFVLVIGKIKRSSRCS
jgi:hypothetical protein